MYVDEEIDTLKIITDENRLKQILLNLISNSVKFTQSGLIQLKVEFSENNRLQIIVKDTGIGIKEEDKHLIFQDNVQLNVDQKYNVRGSGLGLSICKILANSLGYELGFKSNFKQGSQFYLEIKVKRNFTSRILKINKSESIIEEKQILSERITRNMKPNLSDNQIIQTLNNQCFNEITNYNENLIDLQESEDNLQISNFFFTFDAIKLNNSVNYFNFNRCIVVVDDHSFVRENTVNLLNKVLISLNINDCSIIEASDGIELLNIVIKDKNNKIKCIFIDENMDYLNGSETVKIIRKLQNLNKINSYNIVSITALEDNESKIKILKSGVNSIIMKPCIRTYVSLSIVVLFGSIKHYPLLIIIIIIIIIALTTITIAIATQCGNNNQNKNKNNNEINNSNNNNTYTIKNNNNTNKQ